MRERSGSRPFKALHPRSEKIVRAGARRCACVPFASGNHRFFDMANMIPAKHEHFRTPQPGRSSSSAYTKDTPSAAVFILLQEGKRRRGGLHATKTSPRQIGIGVRWTSPFSLTTVRKRRGLRSFKALHLWSEKIVRAGARRCACVPFASIFVS